MGTKNNPGKFDCYEAADPDEPMFILLARDSSAARLVDIWADMREERGDPKDKEKIAEARQCARAMREWQEARNPKLREINQRRASLVGPQWESDDRWRCSCGLINDVIIAFCSCSAERPNCPKCDRPRLETDNCDHPIHRTRRPDATDDA